MSIRPMKEIDGVMYFQCSKCLSFLPKDKFPKCSSNKYGIYSHCLECKRRLSKTDEAKEKRKIKYHMEKRNITKEEAVDYLNNREGLDRKPLVKKIIDGKECCKCIGCYEFKTMDNFWKNSHRCIDCSKKTKKEYHKLNRERRRKQSEERHKNNKDRMSQYYKDNKDIICKRLKAYNKKMGEKYGYNFEYFHIKTRNYAKKNNIVFDKCFICNEETKTQLHHPSYETKDMREFVVPVCPKCHNNIHGGFIDCPSPIKLTDLAKEIKTNDLGRDNKKV